MIKTANSIRRPLIWALAYCVFVAACCLGVWRFAYVGALDQLSDRGRSDLALAADGLAGYLERYREIAVILADHPTLTPVVAAKGNEATAAALLVDIGDKTGSLDIAVIDKDGTEVLSASGRDPRAHSGQSYFERSMDGALGTYHLFADRYGKRAFYISAPIFSDAGPPIGAVLVIANMENVEASWRGDRPALLFSDDLGVVFLSNRSELVFSSRTMADRYQSRAAEYPAELITEFIPHQTETIATHAVWSLEGGRYLPKDALHLEIPVPVVGLRGEVLIDTSPAQNLALLQSGFAGVLLLGFGSLLFLAGERRRVLANSNMQLEVRVANRTADLLRLNTDLKGEIATRRETEAKLTKAQEDLIQAGKLSALGQMSAGISHELNQPLMAIRSFADNAQHFLAKEDIKTTEQNLGRISELSRRMGRIIQNLRSFARQESMPLADVDVVAVIDAVVEISGPKARDEDVDLQWVSPERPILARAGDVRLQQVIVNLVSNAIDAMADAEARVVEISVKVKDRVVVMVRDTGPGIEDPEKIFEPFYSTKAVGDDEGMGLGLSISYGLVQSFGGNIRGRNHPEGGAVFSVELDRATEE